MSLFIDYKIENLHLVDEKIFREKRVTMYIDTSGYHGKLFAREHYSSITDLVDYINVLD